MIDLIEDNNVYTWKVKKNKFLTPEELERYESQVKEENWDSGLKRLESKSGGNFYNPFTRKQRSADDRLIEERKKMVESHGWIQNRVYTAKIIIHNDFKTTFFLDSLELITEGAKC